MSQHEDHTPKNSAMATIAMTHIDTQKMMSAHFMPITHMYASA